MWLMAVISDGADLDSRTFQTTRLVSIKALKWEWASVFKEQREGRGTEATE